MYDVIVIGGGPAGLTATTYCIQNRLETLLITKDLGGKTNFFLQLPFVERHMVINGSDIVDRFSHQIEYLDFARTFDKVDEIVADDGHFVVRTRQGKEYAAPALIIATGARGQLLEVPGEREFMMRGLCYSAVSYAPLFIDRDVAVVGSGDLAMRSTGELARHAQHVTLVAPDAGTPDSALDSPLGQRLQQADNVSVLMGYRVTEVKGDQYARSLVVEHEGEQQEIAVDGIFIEKDLIPQSDAVAQLVELDAKGRIKIDKQNQTSQAGIFAAGDVTDSHSEQVLIAIGEGAKAALSVYEYLLKEGLLSDRELVPA